MSWRDQERERLARACYEAAHPKDEYFTLYGFNRHGRDFGTLKQKNQEYWLAVADAARQELRVDGYMSELAEVEQILGKALGFPEYGPEFFDDGQPDGSVCVGDHTPVTLAMQVASLVAEMEAFVSIFFGTCMTDAKPECGVCPACRSRAILARLHAERGTDA